MKFLRDRGSIYLALMKWYDKMSRSNLILEKSNDIFLETEGVYT
jgi:hypothetical protein